MNDLFLGNHIAGNFYPKESVSKGEYTLEKRTIRWWKGSFHAAVDTGFKKSNI